MDTSTIEPQALRTDIFYVSGFPTIDEGLMARAIVDYCKIKNSWDDFCRGDLGEFVMEKNIKLPDSQWDFKSFLKRGDLVLRNRLLVITESFIDKVCVSVGTPI